MLTSGHAQRKTRPTESNRFAVHDIDDEIRWPPRIAGPPQAPLVSRRRPRHRWRGLLEEDHLQGVLRFQRARERAT